MDNMLIAFRHALSHYATFSGRAARPAFWWYVLAYLIVMLIVGLLEQFLILPMFGIGMGAEDAGQPLSALVSLALLLPSLAVAARRLHDTGRSGWWLLLGLIPVIGFLVLVWFYIQPGEPGENAYGPPPVWPPAG